MEYSSLTPNTSATQTQTTERSFVNQVFAWMFVGLALTAGIAYWFSSSTDMVQYFSDNPITYIVLIVAQLGLVIALSAAINRISASVATFGFCLYAGLLGLTLSVILEVYTSASIYSAFAIAASMFASMALIGWVTKADLSRMGGILMMGLIGLIVAMLVNLFVQSSTLELVFSIVGVLLFCALTAYDMNKIKKQAAEIGSYDEQSQRKAAIFGALALYLDFINLFLFLLRIFGNTR